ncbi:exopolysaccharide biosynthesis protein [Aggregatimonas sangjinii]|uniref:Exopolysaccharide biosynthesis protein n=1 Tax=Aggregatimonas sangjinii TaxID=2583587 RepID=A0A5B7SYH5_9FLAO|nr:sugar transferase [Aggregatimonas sangjinii]QCX01850.1 exopolysaccharide biosynthesis protein [Aggregatimonas sangjinii]
MPRPSILNSIERKFILLIGDLGIVLLALNVFVNSAIDAEFISMRLKIGVFTFGIFVYLSLAYILEFYSLEKVSRRRNIVAQSIYVTGLFVFLVFIFSVLIFDASFWRIPLLSFLLLTPVQIGGWRLLFRNIFAVIPDSKNVLYIYDAHTFGSLREDIAIINGNEIKTFHKVKLTYSIEQDSSINKKFFLSAAGKIDTFIINTRNYNELPSDLEKLMLRSIVKGKEVISFTSFYENTYEAMPIRSHNDSFYELLQLRNRKIRYLQLIFSFVMNFLLSLFVGLIFVLSIPFVFIGNLLFNKGPMFYTQKRVGLYGEEFKIYKFRSMVIDAEKEGAKMASSGDSRITPFGKVLRLFRIDELPQIISVIKGDMQFIGPRPERKVFVKEISKLTPYYNVRHLIRPGITGWAQVKFKYGQNLEDSVKKLEYDFYYIKNKSITLDLRIVLKTVTTVLFSRGI